VSGSSGKAACCQASVIRRANNSATVVITNPEGRKRQFLFVKGNAVASDQPETLSVQWRGDVSVLSLVKNFKRCEIVDALVMGGAEPPPGGCRSIGGDSSCHWCRTAGPSSIAKSGGVLWRPLSRA
jgi:hypothetical protein